MPLCTKCGQFYYDDNYRVVCNSCWLASNPEIDKKITYEVFEDKNFCYKQDPIGEIDIKESLTLHPDKLMDFIKEQFPAACGAKKK